MDLIFLDPLAGQVDGFLFQTRQLYASASKDAGGFSDTQKLCFLLHGSDPQASSIARNFLAGAAQIADNKAAVGGLGLIADLMKLVRDDNSAVQLPGIAAIATVVSDAPMNQERLCAADGAVETLACFLDSPDAVMKEQTLRIFSHIARNGQLQLSISEAALRLVLKCIPWAKTKDSGRNVQAALSILANLAGNTERQELLLQVGACDVFVDYLSSPVLQLRDFALSGLVRGTQSNAQWRLKVAEGDGLRYTIAQLQTSNASIVRQACLIIRNFTLDEESEEGEKSHAAVAKQAPNLLPLLMALLPAGSGNSSGTHKLSADAGVSATALAVLSGLATHESVRDTFQGLGGVNHFIAQIESLSKSGQSQEDTVTSLLSSLAIMLDDERHSEQFLANNGAEKLLSILSTSTSTTVQTEIIRILANICIFEDTVRESIVESSTARSALMKSLLHPDFNAQRQALRALTNVALTPSHIPRLLKLPSGASSNLPKTCVSLIDTKQQARDQMGLTLGDYGMILLINLTSNDEAHKEAVGAAKGGLEWFVSLLSSPEDGTQLRGLKLLTNLSRRGQYRKWLHECKAGVVSMAEGLSRRPSSNDVVHDIRNQATTLLANLSFPYEEFYPDEEQLKSMPLPEIVEIPVDIESAGEAEEESTEDKKKRDEEKKRLRELESARLEELEALKRAEEKTRAEALEEDRKRAEELRNEEEELARAEEEQERMKKERQEELEKVEQERKALEAKLEQKRKDAAEARARESEAEKQMVDKKKAEERERAAKVEALKTAREAKRKEEEEARERERTEQDKLEALMAKRREQEQERANEKAVEAQKDKEAALIAEAKVNAAKEALVKTLTDEVAVLEADVEKRKDRVTRYKGKVEKAKKKSKSSSKSSKSSKSSGGVEEIAQLEESLKSAKRRLRRAEKSLADKQQQLQKAQAELSSSSSKAVEESEATSVDERKAEEDKAHVSALATAKERVAAAKKLREAKEKERLAAEKAHEREEAEGKSVSTTRAGEKDSVAQREGEKAEERALEEQASQLAAKQREIEENAKNDEANKKKRALSAKERREARLAAIQLSKERFQEQLEGQRAQMLEKEKELEKAKAAAEAAEKERARIAASTPLTEEQKREKLQVKRTNIAREILDTELSYVSGLQTLVDRFEGPMLASLQTKTPITSMSNARLLFSCVGIILNFNKILLESLENRLRQWSDTQVIGDVFLKMTDFLKCYVQYVNNYNDAMRVASECRKDKRAAAFLRKAESAKECRHLSFESFLIMPVQRVPRYVMLLADLLKNTWDDHPDKANLAASLRKMQETGNTINEKKRESEAIAHLYEVFATMHGKHMPNLIEPSRRFVKEGSIERAKKESLSHAYLHLFNDLLVVSKPKGQSFEFQGRLELTQLTVAGLDDTKKVKNAFKVAGIECLEKRAKAEYIFSCISEKEREEWITAIGAQQAVVSDKRKSFKRASRVHKN